MRAVRDILNDPVLRHSLKIVAPELTLGVELAVALVDKFLENRKKSQSAKALVNLIDNRLAKVLRDLATSDSVHYRRECEIRAHELLGILNAWDKMT